MINRSFAFACAVTCVVVGRARAVITLDASYDHASLKSYSVSTLPFGGAGTIVDLVGRDNYFGSGSWRWLNFTATGLTNQQPTFRISDNFAGGAEALNSHPMVYSVDNGSTWSFFDNNARSGGYFTFSNNRTFNTANVQVAYAVPYSYAKSVAHAQAVIASPWGAPTLSGGTTGVLGQSPGGTDDLGRVVAPRDIYGYRVTNTAFDSAGHIAKKKVVISTGLHAGETLGTHTYQGLVDFLISDDPRASVLRDTAEFYGYGMLNPDGRFAGNNRATIANPNVDPNGSWNPATWGTANKKDIRVNGQAMINDIKQTPNPVAAFIDFHSTIPTAPGEDYGYLEYEQGDNLAPWWVRFKQLAGTVVDTDSTGTSATTANFAESSLGAQVDVTFETQFGRRRNVDYYNNLGKQLGVAFFETYKPADGDANFDGSVNFNDLVILAQNYGQTTGGSGFERGDFTLDRVVNFDDLVSLAQHYQGTGAGLESDFALAQALVPEPASVALSAILATALVRRRRA